ncbi:metal-dependent hydrolase [Pseudomonas sp. M30-35]|uniref:metal-dependent hydrolase n=1 Tax=Pseudomonas sp. M30-35 TaxID=1981174 RepID=UPI000B3D051A|nr:metal-dependent hydrolase [Pseudomonas sp. M30-35]ARU89894.1 hydrolase [Pseudomonas sp. M30-35]
MASAFAHAVVPLVVYAVFKGKSMNLRLLVLAIVLAIAPDADVLAFKFDVAYGSEWGHRGFTHSLFFAGCIAAFFTLFAKQLNSRPLVVFAMCFTACASHAALDALTNGGQGVALYWPFSLDRVFFPFRPVQVSPIGVSAFFTDRGLRVIASEMVWIFIPGFVIGLVGVLVRRKLS